LSFAQHAVDLDSTTLSLATDINWNFESTVSCTCTGFTWINSCILNACFMLDAWQKHLCSN